MKKIILLLISMGLFVYSFAQSDYRKKPALGVHFFLNDFQSAADIRANGLTSLLKSNQWTKLNRMTPGFALSYLEGLSDHVDFAGTASASFVNYPIPGKPDFVDKYFLLEVAATGNLKLTSDKYWFTPFLTLGAGASEYKGYYAAFIPAGIGLQLNFWDEAFLLINSQYRIPVTENASYHFYHSIGIAGSIFKKKVIAPVELPAPLPVVIPEPPKDRDGDGVPDADDKCPDVAGVPALQGCPDRDGDGIADADDQCPDVAGLAKYHGCPIPDRDHDGINDEIDKCPDVPGVARYYGCPVPDTDNDGVNDEEDKCPNEAGPVSNYGCPVIAKAVIDKINVAAKNIFFATGSAKLLPKSYKSLNEVAKILADNPSYKLDIDGYTDNVGKADKNQKLSEDRAKSVLAYLKSKGVDEVKMNATGYGQEKPLADNKTAAGRAKNRRVEMTARNY